MSNHFLDLFDGGKKLFPEDPIANVARLIMQSAIVYEGFVDSIISQWHGIDVGIKDEKKIKMAVSRLIEFVDTYESLMLREDLNAIKEKWEKEAAAYGAGVTTRPFVLRILPPTSE